MWESLRILCGFPAQTSQTVHTDICEPLRVSIESQWHPQIGSQIAVWTVKWCRNRIAWVFTPRSVTPMRSDFSEDQKKSPAPFWCKCDFRHTVWMAEFASHRHCIWCAQQCGANHMRCLWSHTCEPSEEVIIGEGIGLIWSYEYNWTIAQIPIMTDLSYGW